jgi:multifunctional methyltransferase subunit TRM112
LRCFFRTVKGYPLQIKPAVVILEEAPFDKEMVARILPKIDYAVLQQACQQLSEACQQQKIELPALPVGLPSNGEVDDTLAANLFRVLFEIHVQEGILICPDTGREFPIKEGIPNMILHEDEL